MHGIFPLITMKSILIVFVVSSVCDEENSYKTRKVSSVGPLHRRHQIFSPINFV